MDKPLLTIAIPTYQRAARLPTLLESIAKQLHGSTSNNVTSLVEVVISDNGSEDETWSVCQQYAAQYGFQIRRNAQNIGMDRNIIELTKHARGEFTWWMGDDDWVRDGFIAWICAFLENAQADFFFVPAGDGDSTRAMGYNETTYGTLWDFTNTNGFFRILGTLGHCLFRTALLQDYSSLVPYTPCFSHSFGMLLSFKDRPAALLIQGGFDVYNNTGEYNELYRARWSQEKLWTDGWYKCGLFLAQLVESGLIQRPQRTFFQMFVRQQWPFQFHVLQGLHGKFFNMREEVTPHDLNRVLFLAELLEDPSYMHISKVLLETVLKHMEAENELYRLNAVAQRFVLSPQPSF